MSSRSARKTNVREPLAIVPTFIGAGKTERYYFGHLKNLFGYRLKAASGNFGNENIFYVEKKLKKVLEGGGRAICVFDADVASWDESEKKKLMALRQKYAKNHDVLICDSFPSIEYWFLLHFKKSSKVFSTCAEVEKELLTFIKGFAKTERFLSRSDWVEKMSSGGKLELAVSRAKEISKRIGASYSNVYKAIEELEKEKK